VRTTPTTRIQGASGPGLTRSEGFWGSSIRRPIGSWLGQNRFARRSSTMMTLGESAPSAAVKNRPLTRPMPIASK